MAKAGEMGGVRGLAAAISGSAKLGSYWCKDRAERERNQRDWCALHVPHCAPASPGDKKGVCIWGDACGLLFQM